MYKLNKSDKTYLSLNTLCIVVGGMLMGENLSMDELFMFIISTFVVCINVYAMNLTIKQAIRRFNREHGDKEFEARIKLVEEVRDAMSHDGNRQD